MRFRPEVEKKFVSTDRAEIVGKAVGRGKHMKSLADGLVSDLAATIASYQTKSNDDRDLAELHKLAESAHEMLTLVRQHQLERSEDPQKTAMLG